MPLFCLSIGLTQGEIGIKEVICSITYLLFNIPTGWLADRLSRKVCNFIGDILYGTSLVILALSTSFAGATIAGVVMAFGNACTHGADEALFKAHCDKLGVDYENASKRLSIVLSCISPFYYACGGVITMLYGMKTTLLIASIPFFIAAFISCFILEIGVHKEAPKAFPSSLKDRLKGELGGMVKVVLSALLKKDKLAWLLMAYAVAATMGGPIMVFIGPMILTVGRSEGETGFAYILIALMGVLGGWISLKASKRWPCSKVFLWTGVASLAVMALTSAHLVLWTVLLHICIVHLVRRTITITLYPLVHKAAPDDIQATIGSLMSSTSHALYMIVVVVINFAGNHGVQWGIAANAILFLPLVAIVTLRMRQQEKEEALTM